MAGRGEPHGLGGEEVIALDALALDARETHGARQALDGVDLLAQRIGHGLALGLVGRVQRDPIIGLAEIEEDERRGRLLEIDEFPE